MPSNSIGVELVGFFFARFIYCCVAIPDRVHDITLRIIIITNVIISLISQFANKKALANYD